MKHLHNIYTEIEAIGVRNPIRAQIQELEFMENIGALIGNISQNLPYLFELLAFIR